MKKIIFLILMIILMSSCKFNESHYLNDHKTYPKVRYYVNEGKYKGYSQETSYGKTRYYDKKGRYKGYSKWERTI